MRTCHVSLGFWIWLCNSSAAFVPKGAGRLNFDCVKERERDLIILSGAQDLFLAQCSDREMTCSAGDSNQTGRMQGKHLNPCILWPAKLSLWFHPLKRKTMWGPVSRNQLSLQAGLSNNRSLSAGCSSQCPGLWLSCHLAAVGFSKPPRIPVASVYVRTKVQMLQAKSGSVWESGSRSS